MAEESILQVPEQLCINTEKVYDWILEESFGSTTLDVADLPITLPTNAANVQAECMLTDADGTPLPINSMVDVTEVSARQDRQFDVGGVLVTLQRVTFTKTVYVVLNITGVDLDTGGQFLITSDPVPFTFTETAFLCAPAGTDLVVRVSDYTCQTVINRDVADEIVSFGINIIVCQSIQTVTPVTLELTAAFCMPREPLSDQCANPTIPPQCPIIFPGA